MKSTDSKLYFTDVATGEVRSLTGIKDIEFCTNKQQRQELPFKSTFKGTAELEYELSDNETIENLLKYNRRKGATKMKLNELLNLNEKMIKDFEKKRGRLAFLERELIRRKNEVREKFFPKEVIDIIQTIIPGRNIEYRHYIKFSLICYNDGTYSVEKRGQ